MNFIEKVLANKNEKKEVKEKLVKVITDEKTKEKYYVMIGEGPNINMDNKITFVIRNEKGELVSTASVIEKERNGKKWAEIVDVKTNEKYKKRGFADAVLGFAEQEAFIRGYKEVKLLSSKPISNVMYFKRGYRTRGREFFGAFTFKKKIGPHNWIDRRKVMKGKQKR